MDMKYIFSAEKTRKKKKGRVNEESLPFQDIKSSYQRGL